MATGRQVKWLWRAWHSSDGANLTPRDDIKRFWTDLINQANAEAEWEYNNSIDLSFNIKRRINRDSNDS